MLFGSGLLMFVQNALRELFGRLLHGGTPQDIFFLLLTFLPVLFVLSPSPPDFSFLLLFLAPFPLPPSASWWALSR